MAKGIVEQTWIIECRTCKTLYIPEFLKDGFFEKCPKCGSTSNSTYNIISPWRYKWLRFWRNIKR